MLKNAFYDHTKLFQIATMLDCKNAKFDSAFFAESAQNDLNTRSYEDNAIFKSAFSATMLSHASRFGENGE
jgi:hypothetical protein